MKPKLESVQTQLPEPPYPADTKAGSFSFDVETDRLLTSDTWVLLSPEVRPWALMSWVLSWSNVPCGSWPDDDEVIAARLGCGKSFFDVHRGEIMRGWKRHADGRLYHDVITSKVHAFLDVRGKWRDKWRKKQAKLSEDSPGSPRGLSGDSPPSSSSSPSTSTSTKNLSPDKSGDCENSGEKSARKRSDSTPYQKILDLWAEILPELSQPVKLSAARKAQIRARWQDELPDLDSWRECFLHIRGSKFLMGRVDPGPGRRRFSATLDWVTKQENLLKLYEDKYHG